MKVGFGMNIIGIIVVTLCINTIGLEYYGLKTFPKWAAIGDSNITCGRVATTAAAVINATSTTMLNTTMY